MDLNHHRPVQKLTVQECDYLFACPTTLPRRSISDERMGQPAQARLATHGGNPDALFHFATFDQRVIGLTNRDNYAVISLCV